ncbi:MAG: hypothetical protein Q7T63_14210 [Burkholderiaceae bacterium]|nr:hypothetical protein [Burkholderiaceae bacterium]
MNARLSDASLATAKELAYQYLCHNRIDDAVKLLRAMARLAPTDDELSLMLAWGELHGGHPRRALAEVQRTEQHDGNPRARLIIRALIGLRSGDLPNAQAWMQEAGLVSHNSHNPGN